MMAASDTMKSSPQRLKPNIISLLICKIFFLVQPGYSTLLHNLFTIGRYEFVVEK